MNKPNFYLKDRGQGLNPWARMANVFTKEDCERIIELGNKLELTAGTVGSSDQNHTVNLELRSATIGWFDSSSPDYFEIYKRLSDVVERANERFWGFDLNYLEAAQFTHYSKPGDHQDTHMDTGYVGDHYRKLTIVVQLSDPETYTGCDLNLQLAHELEPIDRDQGCVIIFPSFFLHKVTPLLTGQRYSLVSWVCGAPFK